MILSRSIRSALLCIAFSACCAAVFAQPSRRANPLLEMVGQEPCGLYYERYQALCDSLFTGDSLARVELVRLFTEAAEADPTGAWELDRRRVAGDVRFYESRKGGFTPSADYTAEQFAEDLLELARTAEKRGLRIMRLRLLFHAAAVYRIFAHDYEQAFARYLEAAKGVENISLQEFPWKFYLYREIADFYFSFREYADAARFYRRIVEDREMSADNHRVYPALNGLGMCYRYAEEYDKSDSCFRRILALAEPVEGDRYVWDGIAGGNIGYNYLLRGDDHKALAWMESALGKMKRPNDDPFSSHLAANVAAIYLKRGDLVRGKRYLDVALAYHRRSLLPEKSSELLGVLTRYHLLRGDRREAAALLDSTLRAREREQEAFSGLVLRRVEQRLRAADRKVHEERLGAEKVRSRVYRQTAIVVSCALALILLLLILVSVYYRRTRKAYRELVRRSQQWAGVEPDRISHEAPSGPGEPEEPDEEEDEDGMDDDGTDAPGCDECPATDDDATEPTEPAAFDRAIMHAVEVAVIEGKMYKQADLTLDMLSVATGYSRYYVSGALNRCAGVNFNSYVNEQRIKEAVRLMSDPANAELTVDAVAYDAGFNDRKNFYKVFKKVTGLSPTQFRRNLTA